MCGRFTIAVDPNALAARFGEAPIPENLLPRYNLCPGQDALIVARLQDSSPHLTVMRWGLVPSWAKDKSTGYKMINARAETVEEKPTFKRLLPSHRCLVPADGFFEWQKIPEAAKKQPYRIGLKNFELCAFAGLWDRWTSPDGEELYTFTIITTDANDLVTPFHNRMPVILSQEGESQWLAENRLSHEELKKLLRPYPSDLMEAYPVSHRINYPKNDDPECIEAISA